MAIFLDTLSERVQEQRLRNQALAKGNRMPQLEAAFDLYRADLYRALRWPLQELSDQERARRNAL